MMHPIPITARAIIEIKKILAQKGIPSDYGLRLSVKGSHGCAGVNYSLGFDKKKENDISYKLEGIEVLIQKGELMYIVGKEVDFYEGADARGFVFQEESQPESSTTAR